MNVYVVYFKNLDHPQCGPDGQAAAVTMASGAHMANCNVKEKFPAREIDYVDDILNGETFKSNWFYVE